jgi:protein required for attachment to host cells
MPIHREILFVIADTEHVRFVRPVEADNTLHSFSRVIPDEGHRGSAHHAHERDSTKLPTWVVTQLCEAADSYDTLVLVAPAHCLNVIRNHLSHDVAAKLVGTLEKDLTKVPDHELWPHLREWVRPVHREPLL